MKSEKKYSLTVIAISIPALIWSGIVLRILWLWFLVPLGLPSISIAHAIGIDIILTFIIGYKSSDNKPISELIATFISKPLTYLIIGFVIYLFM